MDLFCMWLISRKLCRFLLMFSTGLLHSMFYFFFLYWSPSLPLSTVFDSILSIIDEVLLISHLLMCLSLDINVHYKDWLTYFGRTDRAGEPCYNFSLSHYHTQVVIFHTQISLILTPWLVLQWCSFHWEILVMLSQFLLTFQ